ncbi:short-chain dehydrogenase/reductase [Niastella yeongjuensis]|uniref:Short-chain dehydrogenase/reductase n=1 Tax=Niastella yeongjuensis TaxID=354355 RepID=A0A1V9EXK9_9BACT|nr:oxidoreductase [Niastella yeongjuensis]OQP50857.1 short-chain dehydrogenase/reductase [Niastella yeongjuensis]SEN14430.1 NADP-dependent 3-hydroxy acid dehydrogenase YdfG [Niastella yeongjuensis]
MNKKTWFVTGASKGLGLILVKTLLNAGYRVAATSRNINELQQAVGVNSDAFLPLAVDLTNEQSVDKSIKDTIAHFGVIDMVVNNAGYGLLGGLEELSDAEVRQNFEVNVFAVLNVIRKVLPYLRKQKSGHIFNISSIGGFTGNFPGFGSYAATKFAMHGFSESLAAEIKPFGIKVTIVSPGYFRTQFLAGSLSVPKNEIEDYKLVRESQQAHQQSINHNQAGDPAKAAKVMIEIAEQKEPPLHLFLGKDAYQFADAKIKAVEQDMAAVKELATSTDIDQ